MSLSEVCNSKLNDKIQLKEVPIVDLIEAVEERGYIVFDTDDRLGYFETNELIDELENRTVRFIESDNYEEMKDVLESQGHFVYDRDPVKELLEKLYRDIVGRPVTEIKQCIDDIFKRKIERWL